MSFNKDWRMSKIGEEIDLLYGEGLTKKDRNEGEYPVYGSNGITDFHNDYLIEAPGIIVGRKGTIGKVEYSNKNFWPIDTTYYVNLLKKNNNLKFWYYFLKSFPLEDMNSHSAVPGLNREQVYKLRCLVPPLKEQEKIANILSSLDKKIENNNKMNKTLEEMAQAIYKSWFVDFEPFQDEEFVYNGKLKKEIPKSFNVSTIGKELRVELGGTPLRREDKYWDNGNINWIKSGKVNEFRITEPSEHITQEGLDNSSTVLLPKGTVVIAITGATLGQVSRLEIESCANQSVVGIVEFNEIPSQYIYLWLLNRINVIIQKQTGGAQQHINKTNVKKSLLLLPPQNVMNNFIRIIKPIFHKISNNCFENKTLKQLRDNLLPKLMSGEIRVPIEENKEV